ncbi:EF-hand domain-containing protein [Rhodovulum sulfidophilum]|uniref:EF-hand domain-containing protein n=1 Tax=Rhodovulum sulfidophilum TaxID=35806 RepID=UPI001923BFAD|nr:EF-hand domain-containing protein [Rhodovulum sulfidophilum]MBL3566834.1 EF-hand domain-containing protein [Rhodovulum sulfidophilum]
MARNATKMSSAALAIGAAAILSLAAPAMAQQGPGAGPAAGAARQGMLFDRMDADGDGAISLDEFTARARARFAGLDTDGDGMLSPEEVQKLGPAGRAGRAQGRDKGGWRQGGQGCGMQARHGMQRGGGMGQGMGQGMMGQMGQVGPGMGGACGGGPGGMGPRGAMQGQAPMGYGGFGDPSLSPEDRAARAERLIEMLDGDGDGQLSAEELATRPGPEMMFNRIDADGDGSLSQDEFEAAIRTFRGMMRQQGPAAQR